MSEELKPCPFCGSKDVREDIEWETGMLFCAGCGYGMTYEDQDPEAVKKKWNTRPIEDELRKIVEEAFDLSKFVAAIHWDGAPNTKEWLDELYKKTEHFQSRVSTIEWGSPKIKEGGQREST